MVTDRIGGQSDKTKDAWMDWLSSKKITRYVTARKTDHQKHKLAKGIIRLSNSPLVTCRLRAD